MSEETSYYYKWGYEFWDEVYEGEKNSKKERHGIGQVKWSLDVLNEWRFEDWARIQDKEYDFDDKLNCYDLVLSKEMWNNIKYKIYEKGFKKNSPRLSPDF